MTTEQDVFVAVDADGKVASRRVHAFQDCSFIKDDKVKKLTVAEQMLLGLKQCVVCTKRLTGGPAIDVLEGFFGEDWPFDDNTATGLADHPRNAAWSLFSYLKEHGFYLAQRQPKSS